MLATKQIPAIRMQEGEILWQCIYVGMDNSVEVEFKCSDPYQEVLAIMSEVQNE